MLNWRTWWRGFIDNYSYELWRALSSWRRYLEHDSFVKISHLPEKPFFEVILLGVEDPWQQVGCNSAISLQPSPQKLQLWRLVREIKFSMVATQKFFLCSPRSLGKWSNLTKHMFQMGWFNHQLEFVCYYFSVWELSCFCVVPLGLHP